MILALFLPLMLGLTISLERCYLLFKLVLKRVNTGVLGARGTGWEFPSA